MFVVYFLLELYFAAALGVAGIAKLDSAGSFLSLLYNAHFPKWSIAIAGKAFPWFEILLSLTILVMPQEYMLPVSLLLFSLFLTFFCFNFWMVWKSPLAKNCGCYGQALKQENLEAKTVASFFQLLLVCFFIFFLVSSHPASNVFFRLASILICCGLVWLLMKTLRRKYTLRVISIHSPNEKQVTRL